MAICSTNQTDLSELYKPLGAEQPLDTFEHGDARTRLDFCTRRRSMPCRAAIFEVVQRTLVPKPKGLRITLSLGLVIFSAFILTLARAMSM